MYNQKFYFYLVCIVSFVLRIGIGQNTVSQTFEKSFFNKSVPQNIVTLKPKVKPELNNYIVQNNKGFLNDIKEGFEDIKDGAVDLGEDIKDGAVDVGEDVKDDAVDVGEDVKDGAIDVGEDVKDGAVDVGEDIKDEVR